MQQRIYVIIKEDSLTPNMIDARRTEDDKFKAKVLVKNCQ
jgi:hypothetical protein